MSTLVNLTPHPVDIILPSGKRYTLPACTTPARVVHAQSENEAVCVAGEDVEVVLSGRVVQIDHLPPPAPNQFFITSLLVAQACPERPDLLIPATGPRDGVIRNERGQVTAVTRLKRLAGT